MKRLAGLFALLALLGFSNAFAQPANVAIAFSPTTIAAGGTSQLSITISNPQSVSAVSGGAIASFSYASGVVNAATPNVFFFGCGTATVTANAGAGGMSASGIDIGFLSSCSIFIDVTSASPGAYTTIFPIGGFSGSTGTNPSSSSATLTVNPSLVVTNANDSGAGSLRQAMTDANTNCASGPWAITFNISPIGTIQPTSALPLLSCANTVINGYTQSGASANTMTNGTFNAALPVVLDGSLCSGGCYGLVITQDNVSVTGLKITNWGFSGVSVQMSQTFYTGHLTGNEISNNASITAFNAGVHNGGGLVVLGNGTAAGVNYVHNNSNYGVWIVGTSNLVADFNIITANAQGIYFDSAVNGTHHVIDNFVVANSGSGIAVGSGSSSVVMFGNAAYGGSGPGIDLNGDGPTPNDEASVPYDTDGGPNLLLNYPVVTSVIHSGSDTLVQGYLKTSAPPGFQSNHVELWDNSSASTVNVTQGQTFLTSFAMTLDGNGFGTFSVTVPGVLASNVSAQVTIDTCGDNCIVSSEFSPTVAVAVATLSVSPPSLTFGSQHVGTASAPQTVTLTNTGGATLTFSSFSISADFVKSVGCGATLAAGNSCTVDVAFAPSSGGNLTGTLSIASDASGSPHTVSLQGTGIVSPSVTKAFAPSSVIYGGQSVLTITIANPNPIPIDGLTVVDVYPTGIYNWTTPNASTTCLAGGAITATAGANQVSYSNGGASVPAGGSCQIAVTVFAFTNAANSNTNTIPAGGVGASGGVSSSQGVTTTPASAVLTVTATPTPAVSLSTSALNFGSVVVGTISATQDIVITNSGTASLIIANGATSAEFGTAGNCDGAVIAPSASCTEQVHFAPTSLGGKTGTWTLTSNAPGSPHTVALSGTGVAAPAPAVSLSPTSLTFPSQPVGTTSSPQSVTLTNTGTATLNISSITISGDFAQSTTCPITPATLAPGASCSFSVTFTPIVAGGRVGQISIVDNASGSPHVISLSGTGVATTAPVVSLSSISFLFPDTTVGATSASQTLTVTNSGTAPLVFSDISAPADFPITTACTIVLPGSSCTIAIEFRPTSIGTRSDSLRIATNAASSPNYVSLTGSGVPMPVGTLSAAPSPLTFTTSVVTGSASAPRDVTITNTGNAPVTVSSIIASANFQVSGACGTIAAGASCVVSVRFVPTQLGTLAGSLTILSNATNPILTIALSGRAVATPEPQATLSATSLGFGNQFVPVPGPPQLVTLRNTGQGPLNINGIFVGGDFRQTNNCGATLAPGQSCEISVRMAALLRGLRIGVLQVLSNAPDSPATVALSGTGCAIPSLSRARVGSAMLCAP